MDIIAQGAAMVATKKELKPMARPSDTEQNGGLKYALERTEKEAGGAMAMARDTARMLGEHMIRCDAGTKDLARDIADMRKDLCRAAWRMGVALALSTTPAGG